MEINPYNRDASGRFKGCAAIFIIAVLFSLVTLIYTDSPILNSITISLIYTFLITLSGYYYWYISSYLKPLQAKLVFGTIVIFITTTASYTVNELLNLVERSSFIGLMPVFVSFNSLIWIIIVQDYAFKQFNCEDEQEKDVAEVSNPLSGVISVKEGSKIFVIKTTEIQYIQAYGDYVMIVTESGKYLKEKTMKYLENNLPDMFVRIHRSYIVNSTVIERAELLGKESYSVYLKNGECIRASVTGYKLLKEKLSF